MAKTIDNIKVTVIIPCFNMEGKIHRMLDSLLAQTVRFFTVYIIDDGSSDKSKDIIAEYIPKFDNIGVVLNYVYQNNAGVSSAVNNGLSKVETEFFCLPDADDFLGRTYLEECVTYLSSHKECGVVFTQCNVFKDGFFKTPVGLLQRKDQFQTDRESICMDFIWGNNVYYCPDYMIRTSDFFRANGSMQIESGRSGQNYQMLLPIVYYYKSGYIEKPLYNYVIYKQSISHGHRTLSQRLNSLNGGIKSLHETITTMNLSTDKSERFHYVIEQKEYTQKALIACEYGDRKLFEEYYKKIENDFITLRLKVLYTLKNFPLFLLCYSYLKKMRDKLR